MSSGRKSLGRQKIEMKKISNGSNLHVTFSKRRNGLFKKASELSTLCGVEVVVIVFSPGEKVFSFGHPTVDTIIDRYLSQVPHQNNSIMQFIEAHRNAAVRELNVRLTQNNNTLDFENRRNEELSRNLKGDKNNYWWVGPINAMIPPQLEMFKKTLEELKIVVAQQANRLAQHAQQSHLFDFNNIGGGRGGYGPGGI